LCFVLCSQAYGSIYTGPVEIRVDGVAARLNAGSVLFWSPNVKRTLINIGTKPVTYEVFRVTTAKSPRQ